MTARRDEASERGGIGQARGANDGLAAVAAVAVGGFGLFASGLIAGALGLGAFCVSCFLAIVGILIWNESGRGPVNFADSYLYVALPVGVATLCVSGLVLLGLWFRRKIRG